MHLQYWYLAPKTVIHRMPDHGAGAPARDGISSLRSSLSRRSGGGRNLNEYCKERCIGRCARNDRFRQSAVSQQSSLFGRHHSSFFVAFSSLHHHRSTSRPPAQDDCERIENRSALTAAHFVALSPTPCPLFLTSDNDDQLLLYGSTLYPSYPVS